MARIQHRGTLVTMVSLRTLLFNVYTKVIHSIKDRVVTVLQYADDSSKISYDATVPIETGATYYKRFKNNGTADYVWS